VRACRPIESRRSFQRVSRPLLPDGADRVFEP